MRCGNALVGAVSPPVVSSLAGRPAAALPIVQPNDWPGRAKTANRSLCFLPRIPGTPWLALHYQVGESLAYVGPERLQVLGQSFVQVERGAIANMAATPGSWRPFELPALHGKMPALGCIDDARACERILEQPFMAHAQAMFGGSGLAAAIPQRGMLLVTDSKHFESLMKVAAVHYAAATNPPITPWVFAVHGGVIAGRWFDEGGQLGLDAVTLPPEYAT